MPDASKVSVGKAKSREAEGHGDNTQPAGFQSPATFIPLSPTPSSVNSKSGDLGHRGEQK